MKKTLSIILAIVMTLSIGLTAFAASSDFRPSVSSKDAPVIVVQKFHGKDYDALVLDGNNKVIAGLNIITEITPDGEIIITPISKVDEADPRVNVVYMKKAYDEILSAEALQELESTIPAGMVVRDFFDVTLVGTYANMFEEGKKLFIKFDIGAGVNELIQALTRCTDESGWEFVESVKVNDDGTIDVIFNKLCPVIFLAEDKEKVESPATYDFNVTALWTMAGIFFIASAIVFIGSKKKASSK